MGVGAGLYMCDVVKKFTFAISSPDEFLWDIYLAYIGLQRQYQQSLIIQDMQSDLKLKLTN